MTSDNVTGSDNPPINDIPDPIDPSSYASWVYIKHDERDDGSRPDGWWWHNNNFRIQYDGNDVVLNFTIANRGWSDAPLVAIDYFVPISAGIHWHQEIVRLNSGEEKIMTHKFSVLSTEPGDTPATDGAQPWISIRVTDLTTPAPSIAEIKKCLSDFAVDQTGAATQLYAWKRVPGFFVYPCCALFSGVPQN